MNTRFALLIGMLATFCCITATAQLRQYRFKHINVDQGLAHNEVISFYKDRKGFLWIGTTAGLNRYDGYTVRSFLNDVRDSLSLSDNVITSIGGLPDGKIGVITPSGLNIYNPATENFVHQLTDFYNQYNIPEGPLHGIIEDKQKNYWFIHSTSGIVKYNALTRQPIHIRHRDRDTTSIATDSVSAFSQNASHDTWIIHWNGVFEKISPETGKVLYRNNYLQKENKNVAQEYGILVDSSGDVWIFQAASPAGVYFFDVSEKKFLHLQQSVKGPGLNTNIIRSLAEDNHGLIWIGTDHGGINVVDKKDFSVSYILHHEEDEKSIGQNSVNALYKDDDGIIWIGTFKKGLSYYHENIVRFPLYKSYPSDPRSLPFGDVNRFIEDHLGNLWIGTNGADSSTSTGRMKRSDNTKTFQTILPA